jgi:hypothetical protein
MAVKEMEMVNVHTTAIPFLLPHIADSRKLR